MILKYGSFSFPQYMADMKIFRESVLAPTGVVAEIVAIADVTIDFVVPIGNSDPVAYVANYCKTVERVLAGPQQDLQLYDNSGRPTGFGLSKSDSISGIVLTHPPSYETNNPGEWVTHRRIRFRMRSVEAAQRGNFIVSYRDSVQKVGDGSPEIIESENVEFLPVQIMTKKFTKVMFIQEGQSEGYSDYLPWPKLLFPSPIYKGSQSTYVESSPMIRGQSLTNWPRAWRRVYSSPINLLARPVIFR